MFKKKNSTIKCYETIKRNKDMSLQLGFKAELQAETFSFEFSMAKKNINQISVHQISLQIR